MTSPLYKAGDVLIVDGIVTTLTSWPAENNGPFSWERWSEQTQSMTRGLSYYNTNQAGEPLQTNARIEAYGGPAVPNTIGVDPDTMMHFEQVDPAVADITETPAPAVEAPAETAAE